MRWSPSGRPSAGPRVDVLWLFDLLGSLWVLLGPRGTTRDRGSLEYVSARHPRSTVRRARLIPSHWEGDPELQPIEFLVADRRGLSFRDSWDHEEVKVSRDEIGEIEIIDDPDWAGQHFRVLNRKATAYREVWTPEDAGDVRSAIVNAIGRRPDENPGEPAR